MRRSHAAIRDASPGFAPALLTLAVLASPLWLALAARAEMREALAPEPLWATAVARGWGYLMRKLVVDGVERGRVAEVFADPRLPPFDGLRFSLAPREPRSLYRGFLAPASVARARRCRAEHAAALDAAERHYGVASSVVAAILHVETNCGRNTGTSRILPALARLAMAAEPENVRDNVQRHAGDGVPPDAPAAQPTLARARILEETFYPEVRAAFELAARLDLDPLEIRGSGSGAFGIPQFLPSSYLRWARDGDGDGRVSLYDADDAVFSCASYLEAHGWRPGLAAAERRGVIWTYNRSPAYVDTVLALAGLIDGRAGSGASPATATRRVRSGTPTKASAGKSTGKAKGRGGARAAASARAPHRR